jgi:hypothetical protein
MAACAKVLANGDLRLKAEGQKLKAEMLKSVIVDGAVHDSRNLTAKNAENTEKEVDLCVPCVSVW